jgi:6-phosphofructokinase
VGRNVKALALDVVVAIGGDGTMSLAHGLAQVGLQCVGVPKTIDNDIANCERSFGFDTAVATVTESLRRIESTAMSHHRVMIVETMGRHAGWLALESGIAGAADIILLPEIDYDLQSIIKVCQERERRQRYTIICIGEGAKESGQSLTVRERIHTVPTPCAWAASAMCCASACNPISRARCAPRCWAMCSAAAIRLRLTGCWPRSSATMRRSWCWAAAGPYGHAAERPHRQCGDCRCGQYPAHRAAGQPAADHGARYRNLLRRGLSCAKV